MDDLQSLAGVTYLGMTDLAEQGHPVTFTVRSATLRQVLDLCFKGQPFKYRLVAGAVMILPLDEPEKEVLISGRIFGQGDEPLAGATVQVRGSGLPAVATDDSGRFRISVPDGASLIVSSVNYETQEVRVRAGKSVMLRLREKINELSDVVVVSNGYEHMHRKMTTGSFDEVGNELVNRRVGPNILDRIDGISSGVSFNSNLTTGLNQSTVTIRGRSTIFSNPNPLIVVDNFPYSGDINNINPDDVESITILKDAAAAAIWGALSGNGVIVITTKRGKLNQRPRLVLNTSETAGARPDLYYLPVLSARDYIFVEDTLFHQGYYNSFYNSGLNSALSPVVNLLYADSLGQMGHDMAQAAINTLRSQDVRPGLNTYFYRPSLNSQVSLNLSGGGERNQYFLSAGYDRDLSNLQRNSYNRVTIDGANTYLMLGGRLELHTDLSFTGSKTVNDNAGPTGFGYPYAQIADVRGNPLPVAFGLNEPYIDTAGGGLLLDWHYRPLQDLRNADNPTRVQDYRLNAAVRYRVLKGLDIHAFYQYERGFSDNPDYQSEQIYSTRNLINEFSAISNGMVSYAIPPGGILTQTTNTFTTDNARLQAEYTDTVLHGVLKLLAGWELRDIEGANSTLQLYGYDPGQETGLPVDYISYFPQYSSGIPAKIPFADIKLTTSERYLSYYGSGVYNYLGRYLLSGSIRRDESNLFGVNENQKGVPLGSAGLGWVISGEKFYPWKWLPLLKVRVTDGFNGNVNRSVSAYTTANVSPVTNNFGAIDATIINPPNADLRWEKIHVINFGVDFATTGDRFGGTVEYYLKKGFDLIGASPLDPTTGVTSFMGNTANIEDHGFDLTLYSNHRFGAFRWNSTLLFSYVRDKLTEYKQVQATVGNYLSVGTLNPLAGRPLYSVYALKWAGLDPATGDPIGYLNGPAQTPGKATENYSAILNSPDLSNLIYKGPVNPPYFGSWRNSLYWRRWGLSVNILYKMGSYFRRPSINYSSLFAGTSSGHPDFDRRWEHPGDELHTTVPSMPAPDLLANEPRDEFYQFSEVLVEKGDEVRLQDIQLTYDVARTAYSRLPVQSLRVYLYANNLGILWKANRAGIDPDFVNVLRNPRTLAIGVRAAL